MDDIGNRMCLKESSCAAAFIWLLILLNGSAGINQNKFSVSQQSLTIATKSRVHHMALELALLPSYHMHHSQRMRGVPFGKACFPLAVHAHQNCHPYPLR